MSNGVSDRQEGSWLTNLIRLAIKENCCFRLGCTTCGAKQFGSLLMMAMIREYPELRISGTRFWDRHARHLLEALAQIDKTDLPDSVQAREALVFLSRMCWLHSDAATRERMKVLVRSFFFSALVYGNIEELRLDALLAVMETPSEVWRQLRRSLEVRDELSPALDRVLSIIDAMPRRIPSTQQCAIVLRHLNTTHQSM